MEEMKLEMNLSLGKSRTLFPTWSSVDQQEMRGSSSFSGISGFIPSEFCYSFTSSSTSGGFNVLCKLAKNM